MSGNSHQRAIIAAVVRKEMELQGAHPTTIEKSAPPSQITESQSKVSTLWASTPLWAVIGGGFGVLIGAVASQYTLVLLAIGIFVLVAGMFVFETVRVGLFSPHRWKGYLACFAFSIVLGVALVIFCRFAPKPSVPRSEDQVFDDFVKKYPWITEKRQPDIPTSHQSAKVIQQHSYLEFTGTPQLELQTWGQEIPSVAIGWENAVGPTAVELRDFSASAEVVSFFDVITAKPDFFASKLAKLANARQDFVPRSWILPIQTVGLSTSRDGRGTMHLRKGSRSSMAKTLFSC
jgi:hypothetical protein